MQIEERTFFRRWDWNFSLVILALNIVGLINLYSATHGHADLEMSRLFIQQIVWLSLGWTFFLVASLVDYKVFLRLAYPIYFLNLLAIIAVPIVGKTYLGAKRWLDLGPFHFQPSESIKIAMVMVLAKVLHNKSVSQGLGIRDLFMPLALMAIPFAFIVKQPDLGTGLMLASISFTLMLFCRVKTQILVIASLAILISLPIVWNFGLKPYQKNRVYTFLDPSRDPQGTGYNSIQSKIAVGSGQFLGKGFQGGTQAQFEFLPERHTDFIFSVLSEEHGFIGSIFTVGLFIALFVICIRIASQARDKFGALLTIGISSYVFWHMLVNIGMVTGLLPIVGVPLPLLSYGGTSTLTIMFAMGIISSVSLRRYLF